MLLGRLKTKSVLEFVHNTFDVGLGYPCEYLIVRLRFFGTLKIYSQEALWIRGLLDSERVSSDGAKNKIRVLMYNNKIIVVSGHIRILVSFIVHPDVAYSHGRDETKGC